jgi:hypothetical protein
MFSRELIMCSSLAALALGGCAAVDKRKQGCLDCSNCAPELLCRCTVSTI